MECHSPLSGEGYLKTGLSLVTYDDLMHGTIYGPVIVRGDSRHSILNMLVEGRADPSMRMPQGHKPRDAEQIEILRLWVKQGAVNN
jgi:Planctomycete cytochrome C